jgi:cell wall-associated NlpC family hydrolase
MSRNRRRSRSRERGWPIGQMLVVVAVLLTIAGAGTVVWYGFRPPSARPQDISEAAASGQSGGPLGAPQSFLRKDSPARTVVLDDAGTTLAIFTDGARTVRLTGPVRTFTEPKNTTASVTTDAWVRLAPTEWRKGAENQSWFRPWLTKALADRSPDVLAVAVQYIDGAPDLKNADGVRYAGDASFGPVSADDPDGRAENNDFYDYLGVAWDFPDVGRKTPKPDRYGDVDCSGYLRLVYGYRMGYPLRDLNKSGIGLPRRAFAMSKYGPGVEVVRYTGSAPTSYDVLQPGDLLFFDTDSASNGENDHSGIFLGKDSAGHYRFISSRTKADGPTFGDRGGAAILDGGARYSEIWRNARRL